MCGERSLMLAEDSLILGQDGLMLAQNIVMHFHLLFSFGELLKFLAEIGDQHGDRNTDGKNGSSQGEFDLFNQIRLIRVRRIFVSHDITVFREFLVQFGFSKSQPARF